MAQGNPNFNKGLFDCCGAGIQAFFCCICGCECVNYATAMTTMDPNKYCCWEGFMSLICCVSCQRGTLKSIHKHTNKNKLKQK